MLNFRARFLKRYVFIQNLFVKFAHIGIEDPRLLKSKHVNPIKVAKQFNLAWRDSSILNSFKYLMYLSSINMKINESHDRLVYSLDENFIDLYKNELNLDPFTTIRLIYEVCSQTFSLCSKYLVNDL